VFTPCSIEALRPVGGLTGLPAVDPEQRSFGAEPLPEQRVEQDRRIAISG
jgi:hypothetical protein